MTLENLTYDLKELIRGAISKINSLNMFKMAIMSGEDFDENVVNALTFATSANIEKLTVSFD